MRPQPSLTPSARHPHNPPRRVIRRHTLSGATAGREATGARPPQQNAVPWTAPASDGDGGTDPMSGSLINGNYPQPKAVHGGPKRKKRRRAPGRTTRVGVRTPRGGLPCVPLLGDHLASRLKPPRAPPALMFRCSRRGTSRFVALRRRRLAVARFVRGAVLLSGSLAREPRFERGTSGNHREHLQFQ